MERPADAQAKGPQPKQAEVKQGELKQTEKDETPQASAERANPSFRAFADFDSSAYAYDYADSAAPAEPAPIEAQEAAVRWAMENPPEMHDEEHAEPEAALQLDAALHASAENARENATGADVGMVAAADAETAADEIELLEADESAAIAVAPEGKLAVAAGDALLESLAQIPQKMAFKIGEAAEMIGVKQYVLRYWESEFDQLRPKKSKNNQRVYSRRDVETALMIKKLLYVDRFSIEGARSALRALKKEVKGEREIKAVACAHESAIKGLKALIHRIDRAREKLSERL